RDRGRAVDRGDQRRLLLAQIQRLRRRKAASCRPGGRYRGASLGERHGARRRGDCAPGSRCRTTLDTERGIAGGAALDERETRRAASRGARPPRGARRAAPFPSGARDTGIADRAGGSGAARTPARAAQPRAHQDGDDPQSGLAAAGVLDTAFHRTAPEVEQAFALPYALYDEGVRRYGFHGLSYEYIASVLPEKAPEIADGRVVVAHLGNGCSACALKARVSVA